MCYHNYLELTRRYIPGSKNLRIRKCVFNNNCRLKLELKILPYDNNILTCKRQAINESIDYNETHFSITCNNLI